MIKKYVQVLLISIMLFITGINYVNAETEGDAGEILLNKTAIKDDITYGRSATVTLEINANSFTKTDKTDVVLVLDRSASMNGSMSDVKEAAKELVKSLLNDNTKDKVRVGVVTYGTRVFSDYSSSQLTNDASTVNSVIDSIPNSVGSQGTNIHDGLVKANSLLANSSIDTNKVVILLSDGIPTRFIGNNNTLCGAGDKDSLDRHDDESTCTVNGNSIPSTVANAQATTMKNNGIKIYTVGFNVSSGSTTDTFLKNISSDPDSTYSYLAANKATLINAFNAMVKNLTIVATNGVVTDTVPKGFRIKEGTLPSGATAVVNEDGTTTITWNVGDIDSSKKQSLSYVVEAVDNEYGSMYTNVKAELTATSAEGNPKYGSSMPLTIEFEKPYVPIPGITVDDNYTTNDTYFVKQGTTLTVQATNGILANDKLEIKNIDENASVTDKIVLVENGTSLDYINVDETTGAFTFTANKTTIDTITYKYYVESTVVVNGTSTVVKSNTSTITLKVIKNPTKYTVNYLEEGTTKKLATSKETAGNVYDSITENAIDIAGYTKVAPTSNTIELKANASDNVINFYYKKRTDLSYTVNYLEEGTNKVLADKKEVSNQTYLDTVTETAVDISGYDKVGDTTKSITINVSNNVINFYYKKRTDLSYTVNYLEEGTNKVLADKKEVSNQTYLDTVTETAVDISGYDKVGDTTKSITINVSNNVINFYYKKRTDLSYTVNYLEEGTDKELEESKKVSNMEFESKVNSSDEIINIEGYDYDSISPEILVIGVEKNVINIYYTKRTDLSYEVNYLEEGTNKVLADKKIEKNQTYLDVVTETAIDIIGYDKVGDTTKTITIAVEGNVINFYYTAKEVKYVVNYLDKNTNEKIRDSKNLTAIYGTKVESESHIEDIYGYRYDSSNVVELLISSNEEENIINLYYTAINGKVIVKYEDENGNDIADPTIIEGNVSDDYETAAKEFEKYVLVEVKGNEKGQITEEDTIVRYVYETIPDTGLFVNNNSMYGLVGSIMLLFVLTFVKKKINL